MNEETMSRAISKLRLYIKSGTHDWVENIVSTLYHTLKTIGDTCLNFHLKENTEKTLYFFPCYPRRQLLKIDTSVFKNDKRLPLKACIEL